MKKGLFVIGVLGLAAAAAWVVFNRVSGQRTPDNELLVSGNIEAHESLVSFKTVRSRIVELPFDEGQWVDAGTLLARLDASDYRKQVEVNQAAVTMAEQQLAAAIEKVEVARATVLNDRADLAQRQLDYARRQRLFNANAIAAEDRDLALTAQKQSQAALQRDLAAARSADKDVEVAKATIQDAHRNLELSDIILGYTTLRAPFSGVILGPQCRAR